MAITRRSLVLGAAGLSLAAPLSARAEQQCNAGPYGALCTSSIPITQLARIYAAQSESEWCWAASISMIFGYYGHPVQQARIVSDAYGGVGNMQGNETALLGSLNRQWTDDNGQSFSVQTTSVYSADDGYSSMSNESMAEALQAEQPVLYCTAEHAMVLTAITLSPAAMMGGWVMDPWPGKGLRRLTGSEMTSVLSGGTLRMAATIAVEDA